MGCRQSAEEQALRSQLQPPLSGARARAMGVIGTWALDADFEASGCGTGLTSPVCCCLYRGEFRVPWPCTCCGANCCCCPHAPAGAAFQAAMAGGFASLLAEAGRLAMEALAGLAAGGAAAGMVAADGSPLPPHVLLGNLRAARFAERWTPRANAFLQAYGLRVAVFNYIVVRRDDKGNKVGEAACCALQFYNAAAFEGAGGFGVLTAGLTGAIVQQQQPPFYGSPPSALAPKAPAGFALAPGGGLVPIAMAVPVATPLSMTTM